MKTRIYATPAVKGLKMARCLRRWAINKQALGERLMFDGYHHLSFVSHQRAVRSFADWPELIPANTRHSAKVGLMLDQRRRRWASIKPALDECLVFAGNED